MYSKIIKTRKIICNIFENIYNSIKFMDPENLKNLYISDLLFKLKFMKKIFLILFSVLIINLVPNLDTFASSNTKEVANKYIQDASTFDYFWK